VISGEEAVAAVVAIEPRFGGIQPRDSNLIGQSAWSEVAPASGVGAFVVRMTVGWGDCPSGCIDQHMWTYAVAPDGTVTLQAEAGPPVPNDAWPAPGAGASGDGTADTGVAIEAVAGPVCPVERPNDPACAPRPVPNATIHVLDASGREVATGVTGEDGAAAIAVPPGEYEVRADAVEGLMGTPAAVDITVGDGGFTPLRLEYDTGIR
jgi:hypothetical protein